MDIADSQTPRLRFEKLILIWRALLERVRSLLPARWFLLLAGIGCIAYSQYMMEQRSLPGGQVNTLADQWNLLYRLEVINLSNVLAALPYLVAGAFLCACVALPSSWKE